MCFTESFESLSAGLQTALWKLGGGPHAHRTDRLSAAVHQDIHPEMFTRRYHALLAHYQQSLSYLTPSNGPRWFDSTLSFHISCRPQRDTHFVDAEIRRKGRLRRSQLPARRHYSEPTHRAFWVDDGSSKQTLSLIADTSSHRSRNSRLSLLILWAPMCSRSQVSERTQARA